MKNTNQMIQLTQQEMLNLWKQHLHLDDTLRECSVERDDGIDLDAWLTMRIKVWYARLLAQAPARWLPTQDVSDEVTLSIDEQGCVTASIPPQCVRPLEWKLDSWQQSVTHFYAPHEPQAMAQHNPWTQAGTHHPVAVDHGDRLCLFSAPAGTTPRLTMATCVVCPADGSYVLHTEALASLPSLEHLQSAPVTDYI